jgi:hypothetical protein
MALLLSQTSQTSQTLPAPPMPLCLLDEDELEREELE